MSIYEQKHKLYRDYCVELNSYRAVPDTDTDVLINNQLAIDTWCDTYINDENCTWRNIFDEASGNLVGFLIVGKGGSEKHPDADFGIAQAYIAPEFRNQGLMTKTIKEYLGKHKGLYSLLVLEKNTYALKFWKRTFAKEGYHPMRLDDRYVIDGGDDLILLGFAPNKERKKTHV